MPVNSLGANIARKIWAAFVVALMLLAVYVSVGRIVMPRLDNYQAQIETVLSDRLGMQVVVQSLQGEWQGLQPVASLQQVSVHPLTSDQDAPPLKPVLEIRQLVMKLDVVASVLAMQPVFSTLTLDGMHFDLLQDQQGKWSVSGMPAGEGGSNPLNWLLLQKQLILSQVELTLQPYKAPLKQIYIPEWGLRCRLTVCSSQGSVELSGGADTVLQFSLNIYDSPSDPDFRVQGYLASPPLSLMEWLPLAGKRAQLLDGVDALMLGGEVWFEWDQQQLVDVRGTLDLPEIRLGDDNEAMAAMDSLHTDFVWKRETDQPNELWALWLNDLTFKWAGNVFEPAQRRFSLLQSEQGQVVRLIADRFELEPISNTLLGLDSLPGKLREVLSRLNPRGQLANVHFDYKLTSSAETSASPDFKLQANFNGVAVSAWKHAPAASGINGYIEVYPTSGMVDFESNGLQLHFPRVYRQGWQFEQASGEVNWLREGDTLWLKGKKLALTGEVGNITGQFSVLTSKDGIEPRLSLLMGLENSHLPDALTFVPDQIMAPKAVEWLQQAFTQGDVKRARFVLDQRLVKGTSAATKSLAMDVEARQVDFSYYPDHPDWPHLTDADVNVQIVDRQVDVTARKARIYDLVLHDIKANYLIKPGASRLKATADVKGELKQAWWSLTKTPLRKNLFELADDFQFSGQMRGQLALDLPFDSLAKSNVELDFSTQNGGLNIPSLDVSVGDIRGDFSYSSQAGLVAPQFSANMFGFPVQGSITSQKTVAGLSTELAMQGHLKVASLSPWVPATVLDRLAGETDYQAQLSFGRGSNNQLQIDSTLKGVAVDLPVPLGKKAQQPSTFSFNLALSDPQIHTLRYADLFGYSLMFNNKGYQNGEITIGSATPRYTKGAGILVKGTLPELNYEQWSQVVEKVQAPTSSVTGSSKTEPTLMSKIKNVQLDVARFDFLDESYDKVKFTVDQHEGDWSVAFENPIARGVLRYYPASRKPLAVDFDYLYLPDDTTDSAAGSSSESEQPDVLSDRVPQQLPELDLRVSKLFLGQQPFGSWAFNMRPNNSGVKLENVDFQLRGLQIKGEADWLYSDGEHNTQFRGDVLITDVAAMLKAWQKAPAIEGKDAQFQGQLTWPGSPANFSLLTMQGPLTLTAKQGRIVDLQSIPLLGVFNFNTLARRLRFDFSDLFKKGFSFDSAEGAFQFERGTMQLSQPLIIDGPSAKFKVDGQTDLVNEQFDHDVIVVLPVTGNIPVIATLAGLPQVGIPMYLFNRAFGDVLDRFTSVNYKVSGSWKKPKVVLSSFFDTGELPDSKKSSNKRRPKR